MVITFFVNAEGSAGPDNLMNRVPKLYFDIIALSGDSHIRVTQFTKKIKGRSSLLPKGKLKRVLIAALFYGLVHIICYPVKAVGWTGSAYALVGTLVIVITYPVIKPLAGVGKGGEDRIIEELRPYGLPEPLDLAESHGMVGRGADMGDALALENLLELRLTSPGRELTAVVRKDLSWSSPLAYSALNYLKDSLGCLPAEKAVADQITRAVIYDAHKVDRVHTLQLEGKNINLP
jgi:hypothetical protein